MVTDTYIEAQGMCHKCGGMLMLDTYDSEQGTGELVCQRICGARFKVVIDPKPVTIVDDEELMKWLDEQEKKD